MLDLLGWFLFGVGAMGAPIGYGKAIVQPKFWTLWLALALTCTFLVVAGLALIIDGEELLS